MSLRIRLPIWRADPFAGDEDRALVQRFVESHDESAFAGLVSRPARMVLGVCRRTVGDTHLAEDAFQAVFLVLARNPRQAVAASSVGGWLFGIARRVGLAARRHELRRQKHLTHASTDKPQTHEPDFDDLLRVLDEELAALPEAYRAPLVACFLEERTQDDAAKQLGWSLSTLRRRLDRGKELLHARLMRRGVTLAAGLFAGALAPSVRATVPPGLLASALPACRPSPLANALASEVVRASVAVKAGLAVLIVAAVLGGLAVTLEQPLPIHSPQIAIAGSKPGTPIASWELAPSPRLIERNAWVTISGRVVFPEKRELPAPKQVPVGSIKDRGFFTPSGELLFHNDVAIDPTTRGIANVMVWLRPDSNDRKATFPQEKIHPRFALAKATDRFFQAGRDGFQPRVMAARVGDRVVFSNTTSIPFNVHYQRGISAEANQENGDFNILLPSAKTHETKPLPSLLSPDSFSDAIHPWVQGYVWSFDHPYYAVTDESGNFQIKDAPEGSWRLVFWHEKAGYKGGMAGRLGQRISIAASSNALQNLEPLVLDSKGWDEK